MWENNIEIMLFVSFVNVPTTLLHQPSRLVTPSLLHSAVGLKLKPMGVVVGRQKHNFLHCYNWMHTVSNVTFTMQFLCATFWELSAHSMRQQTLFRRHRSNSACFAGWYPSAVWERPKLREFHYSNSRRWHSPAHHHTQGTLPHTESLMSDSSKFTVHHQRIE